MKKLQILFCAALLSLSITSVQAQALKTPAPSPSQSIKQSFGLGEISIDYSRPSARNRVIFGDLVPYGKIWRTGANAASKITFTDNVNFGGKDVKAGTYALYTIPGKSTWEVMLYSDLSLGGNVADYKLDNEVARVKIAPKITDYKTETFTMGIASLTATSSNLEIKWENVRVPIKITTEIDSRIMNNIDDVMNKDSKPYYQAAKYYYENGKDLKQAKVWVDKAVEQSPKAFWVRLLKAKIELKLGNKAAAIETANEVINLATAAQNDDYIKMAKKLISQAK